MQSVESNNVKSSHRYIKAGIEISAATALSYEGLSHGLNRALGIRIENHHTTRENAANIIRENCFLNPEFGGKNGFSQMINSQNYINLSKNYVHITGCHKDSKDIKRMIEHFSKYKMFLNSKTIPTIERNFQYFQYRLVKINQDIFKKKFTIKKKVATILKAAFTKKIRTFYIPGTDKYFNSEFTPDSCAMALKSTKKIKVYKNRLCASIAGIKKFGTSGISTNKFRCGTGILILGLSSYLSSLLILKARKTINNNG